MRAYQFIPSFSYFDRWQRALLKLDFMDIYCVYWGFQYTCQYRRCRRHGFDPWAGMIPWRKKWQPTPIFLPGKFHGRGAWLATVHGVTKRYDLDMTEWQFLKENTDFWAPSLGINLKVGNKNILYNKPPWLGLGHHACDPWAKSSHWQNCPMACLVKSAQEWFFTFLKSCRKERKGKEKKRENT